MSRWHVPGVRQPLVFVCSAESDSGTAGQLRQDLDGRGINTYLRTDLLPGDNVILVPQDVLNQSDYFVLLWSHAAVGHRWMSEQWAAALALGIRKRRSFLFLVRLDDAPLPTMLAARGWFDAARDWKTAVADLCAVWQHDHTCGHPVVPAPFPIGWTAADNPAIGLYIRNTSFQISHFIQVPGRSTGGRLTERIRAELHLRDEVSEFGGAVGLRMSYLLRHKGTPVPDDQTALLSDRDTLDLEVTVMSFDSDGWSSPPKIYRGIPSELNRGELSPGLVTSLLDVAFGHLMPW